MIGSMISKEMEADIDVTSMTDDGILNPYKVSLNSDKNVDKEVLFFSKRLLNDSLKIHTMF